MPELSMRAADTVENQASAPSLRSSNLTGAEFGVGGSVESRNQPDKASQVDSQRTSFNLGWALSLVRQPVQAWTH